jgi:hypothetical protein
MFIEYNFNKKYRLCFHNQFGYVLILCLIYALIINKLCSQLYPVFPTTTNKASAKAEAFGFYKRAIQAPLGIASEKKPKPRTFAKQME